MPVTGIGQLRKLAAALQSLANGKAREEIERKLTQDAVDETRRAIASGRGPDGTPWAPGGAGLRSFASTVGASGNRIVVRHQWAGLHHRGGTMTGKMRFLLGGKWRSAKTVRVPARPLVPSSLPASWGRTMKATALAVIQRELRF